MAEKRAATETAVSGSSRTATIKSGVVGGLIASVTVTLIAVGATAAGVTLEIGGEAIPLGAFPWWTLVGAAAGTLTSVVVPNRRQFVVVAVAATALSLIPALIAPDDNATRAVLVATHVAAAAIVIPALARGGTNERATTVGRLPGLW